MTIGPSGTNTGSELPGDAAMDYVTNLADSHLVELEVEVAMPISRRNTPASSTAAPDRFAVIRTR